MSDEYDVHGLHDHAVEHAAAGHGGHGEGDPFASRMAVMTAILASIGAIFAYQSGTSENLALYYKNEAAIRKTEAANQWAYYQAKGEKQNLAELGEALSGNSTELRNRFAADVDKYRQQKEPIRANAEALEKAVAQDDARSEALMHGHHHWAQATTAIQISIALTAITLLTRRRWLMYTSIGLAVAGVVLGAVAFFAP
jgi:phosphoribosyl-AMP cyclohydrolase